MDRLHGLKNYDGEWIENQTNITNEILEHFVSIYSSDLPSQAPNCFKVILNLVTEEMNNGMIAPIQDKNYDVDMDKTSSSSQESEGKDNSASTDNHDTTNVTEAYRRFVYIREPTANGIKRLEFWSIE